ncbi:MAG: hypothetical protein IJ460_00545 [Clostridia bacterium]|nr:hypothetical protein [Clostridia bacterium]
MKKVKPNNKWVRLVTAVAFVISILLSIVTNTVVNDLYLAAAFIVLLAVIASGIFFDVIGLAVATATEVPFHAKAAKRLIGARESIYLIRNADKVSSFCNDVIGDIAGVISGGLAASIVVKIQTSIPGAAGIWLNLLLTASVSAVTIGGKAYFKTIAMNKSYSIVEKCGIVIYKISNLSRLKSNEKR